MSVVLSINPEKETEKIMKFLRETVKKTGLSKVVVGVSGGIDSATSCCLAAEALGTENVFACLFPYGNLDEEGLEDAKRLIKHLRIPSSLVKSVDIKPLIEPIIKTDLEAFELRRGNIMARMRMILLYDLAKKLNALVLGTENKTEHLLGYFTRFGDEASDIEPIRHLYKTQVRNLAKYLGIPQRILEKSPTAGLWQGQTDERELGFSYEEADQILFLYFDKKMPKENVIQQGFGAHVVEKVLDRVKSNEFKHKLPYVI